MVQHVYERASAVPGVQIVLVATDDERVANAVSNFGGRCVITSADHPSGTDRLAEVMASMDVFVHPGSSETFCQTIQEAMACGVPVVAVGRGGPLDLVDSSHTGWLYQPGNLTELRSRVSDLVYDDAKRLAFASAALASVQGRSWFNIGEQLIDHYQFVRMARISR